MALSRAGPIAEAVVADIAAGRLRPGDRLPPQREFARQHHIAGSTAARVYRDLARRGLVVGEVGRGTFVRVAAPPPEQPLPEPGGARIDLELNFPVLPEQAALLGDGLGRLLQLRTLDRVLRPVPISGTTASRAATAMTLARTGWSPDPDRILFAGNGRQAIAAAVAALVAPGESLGVEALTYPVVKAIATRLGVHLVPIAMDAEGMRVDALRSAHRGTRLRAIYLQPTLHNPLGVTMPTDRRRGLAAVLSELGLYAIEDGVYGFLHDTMQPLAAIAPDRTILVDSLSKRVAPGLTLGFLVPPAGLTGEVAAAVKSGSWAASHFAIAAGALWMAEGTVTIIEKAKRRDAALRQAIAAERLAGFDLHADPRAYHCWWVLPQPWRAETFVAAAGRRGIAVTPAAAFAVGSAHAPNAVRLALSSPSVDVLSSALDLLAALAREEPDNVNVD